jgi:hypothetical protein
MSGKRRKRRMSREEKERLVQRGTPRYAENPALGTPRLSPPITDEWRFITEPTPRPVVCVIEASAE